MNQHSFVLEFAHVEKSEGCQFSQDITLAHTSVRGRNKKRY